MEKEDIDKWKESDTLVYTIRWNPVKSGRLKRIRGVSFAEILEGELVGIRNTPFGPNRSY